MSLAELVIVSVKVEGRSKSEVARDFKISRCWVRQLVRRYEAEGQTAFQPRSRRPHSNPRAISLDLEDQMARLRKELSKKGLDAGMERLPSTSTIWRVLTRRGFVTPQPRKRPKGAGKRCMAWIKTRSPTTATLGSSPATAIRRHAVSLCRRRRDGQTLRDRIRQDTRP